MSDGPKRQDVEWYKRLRQSPTRGALDVCQYCPHVRALHEIDGCKAPSASLFDHRPCECTNSPSGSLYGLPSTLAEPETPTR